MKYGLLVGGAVAALLGATSASAQSLWGDAPYSATAPGFYGAIGGGGHTVSHLPLSFSGGNDGANVRSSSFNWDGFASVGYRFSPYLRLELEGSYRASHINSIKGFVKPSNYFYCAEPSTTLQDCNQVGGSLDAWTGMANLIVDLLPHSRVSPFVGGGLGVIYVKLDTSGVIDGPLVDNDPVGARIDNSSTQFGYQGIGGITFAATDRLNIDLVYHYTTGTDVSFRNASFPGVNGHGRYEDNSLSLGLRYSFATPPAPPPPRPRLRLPPASASSAPAASPAASADV